MAGIGGFPKESRGKRVVLHDVDGISKKSGTDEYGNQWTQFEVDYMAEQLPGECSICGKELESGWMCLDGDRVDFGGLDNRGEEVCDEHVVYAEDLSELLKHGIKFSFDEPLEPVLKEIKSKKEQRRNRDLLRARRGNKNHLASEPNAETKRKIASMGLTRCAGNVYEAPSTKDFWQVSSDGGIRRLCSGDEVDNGESIAAAPKDQPMEFLSSILDDLSF